MSKYIIDTETWANLFEVQRVGVYGIGDDIVTDEKTVWSRMFSLDELEELNSDYINEHFGELQDEAYLRGFKDGKNGIEKGCDGCKYDEQKEGASPCCECARVCDDHYIPKLSDRVEVGDIVDVYGKIGVVTYAYKNTFNVMMYDGSTGRWRREDLKKTGKHYDIASILEAMRG